MQAGSITIYAGEVVTIDGTKGEIIKGRVPTLQPQLSGDFATVMKWADATRRMRVRANAETPLDARAARQFGAEGIGLCRTEHMFFDPDRIQKVREMIFAESEESRRVALAALEPAQRGDFAQLFSIMKGLPVTIRLLDPPLHEFLPHGDDDMMEFAKVAKIPLDKVRRRLSELSESNPMLGHRGCRLGLTYPEIYEMQVMAIFEAAVETDVTPEIMIPLVGMTEELRRLKVLVDTTAASISKRDRKSVV